MPGKPQPSRSSITSGVIRPRSSATIGSGPSARAIAANSALPGRRHPAPVDRGRAAGRNLPVAGEAAEVVDAQHVGLLAARAARARSTRRSPRPPCGPSGTADCPSAGPAGPVVRRHAGDHGRLEILVEEIQVRAAPSTSALWWAMKIGRSPMIAHAARVARSAAAPRTGVSKHHCTNSQKRDLVGVLAARAAASAAGSRARRAGAHCHHGAAVVRGLQRHEQRVVVEPVRLRRRARPANAARSSRRARVRGSRPRPRAAGCSAPRDHAREVDAPRDRSRRPAASGAAASRARPAVPAPPSAGCRRTPTRSGRANRRDRPAWSAAPARAPARPAASQSTKLVGLGAEIADAVRAGQRSDVQQDAGSGAGRGSWRGVRLGIGGTAWRNTTSGVRGNGERGAAAMRLRRASTPLLSSDESPARLRAARSGAACALRIEQQHQRARCRRRSRSTAARSIRQASACARDVVPVVHAAARRRRAGARQAAARAAIAAPARTSGRGAAAARRGAAPAGVGDEIAGSPRRRSAQSSQPVGLSWQ